MKVEYSLTEFGKTLIPTIQSIADCGVSVVTDKEEIML
ncbi:winged helix-turn-helix transcriptional regulator [Winogradskyella bathintestinalis]|uniref:Winged helix-turn-helix transcriptional regulator n=1 Tax=Winogradskyella bathintestinalis TaxID=3035208 RepID=A0ABT7ZT56_9FLAO|nr:winged helix-turn-helix transcriptional regulator [Winogradskyella bathintestinalis]MDN3492199.1 winged helix-turn-helix transcriptional regulator [Winogradskyella bathintestinalis]